LITFYDEKGNGYGAQVEFTTKKAVNGERSVTGTIVTNDKVLSKIDRGWSFEWDGEIYKIIFAKPKDEGRNLSVSFDAVHQFFYDFDHSNCYEEFNGSHRLVEYLEAIFKNSGYRYNLEAEAKAIRKENFGNASRLKMFKDIIKASGLEFSVTGKVIRIVKKVGTDLSTVVRKNFNMNELTIEKNINGFITYKRGLGMWKDENDHSKGRYTASFTSPLAEVYGIIEGEPIVDERYKDTGKLQERLEHEVNNSYSVSVQLDMEDLTRAGYKYTQPRAGDYIMAINETIGFREKIRIVSYESSYDVTGRLIKHKVTCNDIGTVQKAITSEGSIMRSVSESKEYAEGALEVATRALVSANGKNTNYYGVMKPKDEPRGTLHEGDLLYLTVGEETELYYWSGSEWLPKILKVDTKKIETLISEAQVATSKAIEQVRSKAEEALTKAGTLPNTDSLSAKIKEEILKSKDLSDKINRTFTESDNGTTIYNKIAGEVSKKFVTVDANDARYRDLTSRIASTDQTTRVLSEDIASVRGKTETITAQVDTKVGEIDKNLNKAIIQVNDRFGEVNQSVVQANGRIDQANTAISNTNQAVSQTNDRVNQTNRDLATTNAQVAENKRQIEVQVTNFNAVRESTKLFERILGTTEEGAPDKLSRLVMSSEIFQTEVGRYVTDDNNLIVNSMTMNKNTLVGNNNPKASVSVADGVFTIKAQGLTGYNWSGFSLPIYVKKIYRGETYTLGFKYRIKEYPDSSFAFNIKNHGINKTLLWSNIGEERPALNQWQEFQKTFTVQEDFAFGEDANYPFYIYLAKNGWIEFKEPILVRGSNTGPYKPSQFDDAYKASNEAKDLASDAQSKAIQVAEQAKQAQATAEATRTQVTQLAGSWAVRNLNNSGDVLNSINLLANGTNRIDGRLTHITGQTVIDEAVIDSANLKTVSASKISGGIADFHKMTVINFDAENITTGTLKGINVKGSIFSSLDDSFYIDTKKNEFYLNEQTLFTFYNKNKKIYSYLGTGDRLGSDDGGGFIIGVDCDDTQMYKMHGSSNSRDLWTASRNTATILTLGADKQKKTGTILAKAPTGIKFSVKPSGVAYSKTYIEIGNTIGNFFENKIIAMANKIALTADEELDLYSSGKIVISGGGGSSLTTGAITGTSVNAQTFTGSIGNFQSLSTGSLVINRKDLVGYFNNLAQFVVAIAREAGWKNIGDYRI
jgi:hypothetical protein